MPTLFYFPLEPIDSRYTTQLSESWIPEALMAGTIKHPGWNVKTIKPLDHSLVSRLGTSIKTGVVLDATGRGIYSMRQCEAFLLIIREGNVGKEDVIYFQDFWTPGMDAVFYALHLHCLDSVRVYSMLHAQSVDRYDFTYPMRYWIREIEKGLSRRHAGIFVGSTIHKDQLIGAGFDSSIHVVGLPIGSEEVVSRMPKNGDRKKQVVFSSRIDREKNPYFMMRVAKRFLYKHQDWTWIVTTSRENFTSNDPDVVPALRTLSRNEPRFILKEGLSKDEYYRALSESAIQFNCSLQDYVSWTLLEACLAGCDLAYPDFRSFPEIIPPDRLYKAWSISSALEVIDRAIASPAVYPSIPKKCDDARFEIADILIEGSKEGYNVWER